MDCTGCLSGLDSWNTSIYSSACSLPLFYLSSCLLNKVRQKKALNILDFFTPCLSYSPFLLHRMCAVLLLFEQKHLENITPSRIIRRVMARKSFSPDYPVNIQEKSLANISPVVQQWQQRQNVAFGWGTIRPVRLFWTEAVLNLPAKWVICHQIKEEQLGISQHSWLDASEWFLQRLKSFEEHWKGIFHFSLCYLLQEIWGDTTVRRRTFVICVYCSQGLHQNISCLTRTFKHFQLVAIFRCYNSLFSHFINLIFVSSSISQA